MEVQKTRSACFDFQGLGEHLSSTTEAVVFHEDRLSAGAAGYTAVHHHQEMIREGGVDECFGPNRRSFDSIHWLGPVAKVQEVEKAPFDFALDIVEEGQQKEEQENY